MSLLSCLPILHRDGQRLEDELGVREGHVPDVPHELVAKGNTVNIP